MRQIVLDTETTGLEPDDGHRIIEIGCVELINRRLTKNNFHIYLNPERDIDEGAIEVHGITNEFLADKPGFADIADDFLEYIKGAELIIHNAPFDVGFINAEYRRFIKNWKGLNKHCQVLDTLQLARQMHPGQKNSLDALCKRYEVDNSHRELHGALLDAEILADVYLLMTGGQTRLILGEDDATGTRQAQIKHKPVAKDRPVLKVVHATQQELALHEERVTAIEQSSGVKTNWS
jgi:DNA polymerase-3 subunit epsilon